MKFKKPLSALLAALLVCGSASMTVSALTPHGTGILCRNWLKNDPDYTFSDSYKTSVWYENFTALELTDNDRNNILSIAVSQLGYHEGEDGDYSGTNTASAGNCVEYFRLLIPNWSDNSDEWCACFVNWCLNQARIDYASSEIGCWRWVEELKGMNMFEDSAAYKGTYTPRPADMIFFNWKNTNTASGHIGYVLYTTDTHVFTIEGNADNCVSVRSYALNDPCVIGYGTPPYDEGKTPTVDHSYKDGMPHGEYVVSASGLYLYKDPGANRINRVALGSRVVLKGVNGDYAEVIYGNQTGYIKKNSLYLMSLASESTLTFDANGGTGAPAAVKVAAGDQAVIGDTVPTLDGDTFLGWSRIPHNYKVDYKVGDTFTLSGDTTLYAVWEKHSKALAEDALAKGEPAEFERPSAIANSGALLLGTLSDLTVFDTETGSTKVEFYEDAEAGRVLSFTSTEKSGDPYVTLSYKALCEELRLAPVNADKVDYLVLKVKDVSMHNIMLEVFYDCGKGAVNSVSKLLKANNGWQYVVLDVRSAEGWAGDVDRLRIDWQKASSEAGNTMLISDIFFVTGDALRDAVTNGLYIYAPQPLLLEPDTMPETTAPTTPADTGSESLTETLTPAESADDTTRGTTTPSPDTGNTDKPGGCTSSIGMSALCGMMSLGAITTMVILRKKKED